jgi:hypothetical protein
MKSVAHTLAVTTLVIASTAFSGAVNANVFDFDVKDVQHWDGHDPDFTVEEIRKGFVSVERSIGVGTTGSDREEWYQGYQGANSADPFMTFPALPELADTEYVYVNTTWSSSGSDFGYTGVGFSLHLVDTPNEFDAAASWVEFEDGNRVSFQTLLDTRKYDTLKYIGGLYHDSSAPNVWSGQFNWTWTDSPFDLPFHNSKPTHIQLAYNLLGTPGVTPSIPEPETYAMLLAGLSLVGVAARRRRNLDCR